MKGTYYDLPATGQLSQEQLSGIRERAADLVTMLQVGNSLVNWAPTFQPSHIGDGIRLRDEIIAQTENLAAYRIALSSHFALFVDKLELHAIDLRVLESRQLEEVDYSQWLILAIVVGEICSHFNLRPFPRKLIVRFLNASLDLFLLSNSFARAHFSAFCNILRKIPDVSFDLESPVLSFDRDTTFDITGFTVTGSLSPTTRKKALGDWLAYEMAHQVPQPNSTVFLFAALGLQLPTPRYLYGISQTIWNLPTAQERLEAAGFAGESAYVKSRKWESCLACGKHQRTGEAISAAYKQCASCAFATYCSKDCQLRDWKEGHKRSCSRLCASK